MLRKLISGLLVFLILPIPNALFAAAPRAAVLYGNGGVFVNGAQVRDSSAIISGDVIQTHEKGAAGLNTVSSTAMIDSNTVARFQDDGLALDRGSVSVASGNGMAVFASDFKIAPASNTWTQFYVSRMDGAVQVLARKNSLTVSCGGTTSRLEEGQQLSGGGGSCGSIDKKTDDPAPAAKRGILNPKWLEIAGAAGGGVLLGWAVFHRDNVSSSKP